MIRVHAQAALVHKVGGAHEIIIDNFGHVHDGATQNRRVHNIECDIGGFAPNQILISICVEVDVRMK